MTKPYINSAGGISLLTDKVEFQKNPANSGTIVFGDLGNDISKEVSEKLLDSGALGITLPPKKSKMQQVEIKPEIQDPLNKLRETIDLGEIVATKNYSDTYEVLRTPFGAYQFWYKEGKLEVMNLGKAALKTKEVPKEAILDIPSNFSHIYISPLPKNFGAMDAVTLFAMQTGLDWNRSYNLADCESDFDEDVQNLQGSSATGIWQLLGHNDKFEKRGWDPYTGKRNYYMNTVVAIEVFKDAQREWGNGLIPWSCKV